MLRQLERGMYDVFWGNGDEADAGANSLSTVCVCRGGLCRATIICTNDSYKSNRKNISRNVHQCKDGKL